MLNVLLRIKLIGQTKLADASSCAKEQFQDLLDISRVVTGKLLLTLELVNLVDILKRVIELIRPMAEQKFI